MSIRIGRRFVLGGFVGVLSEVREGDRYDARLILDVGGLAPWPDAPLVCFRYGGWLGGFAPGAGAGVRRGARRDKFLKAWTLMEAHGLVSANQRPRWIDPFRLADVLVEKWSKSAGKHRGPPVRGRLAPAA